MKKFTAIISAVMASVLLLSMQVSALPSPTAGGIITGIEDAKDEDGSDVLIYVKPVEDAKEDGNLDDEQMDIVEDIRDLDYVKDVLEDSFEDGMQVVDIEYVGIEGDESLVEYPLDVTFKMTGATKESEIYVMIYDEVTGEWFVTKAECGDGTIRIIMPHTGLISVIVDRNTAAFLDGSGISPKTGMPEYVKWAAFLGVISMIGLIKSGKLLILYKKTR